MAGLVAIRARLARSTRDEPLSAAPNGPGLPLTDVFYQGGVWLDSAYLHPMSLAVRQAITEYLQRRTLADSPSDSSIAQREVIGLFARLINADVDELSFVPGANAAENYIVAALGLSHSGRIVTDSLHYWGSLYLYDKLRERGVAVTVVEARDGRIDPADLTRALAEGADLLALSWVSNHNGFQHDLAEVCRIAHLHGTLVYADIVQGVGAVPLDVHATCVDFCGTSAYKWLMADLGVGFLYVRRDLLARLRPVQFGGRQLTDPPRAPGRWNPQSGASGLFECGSIANMVIAALRQSLTDILMLGVPEIAAYRRELLDHLREAGWALGLKPLAPPSAGPILAFGYPGAKALQGPLRQARVYVTCYEDRIRIAPSVFNCHADVDKLMDVLKAA